MALGAHRQPRINAYAGSSAGTLGCRPRNEALPRSIAALQFSGLPNATECPAMKGLEFLGDSVLDMIVVDMLLRKFPERTTRAR